MPRYAGTGGWFVNARTGERTPIVQWSAQADRWAFVADLTLQSPAGGPGRAVLTFGPAASPHLRLDDCRLSGGCLTAGEYELVSDRAATG